MESDKPHLLSNTTEIFDASSSSGDYHGNFDTVLYTKWFTTKLLPELQKLGGLWVIILDNASYHCSFGSNLPKGNDSKATYFQKMVDAGISCDASATKGEMIEVFNKWKECTLPELDRLCTGLGYRVLRTPKYESELQPIEYLWAFVKKKGSR